MTLSLQLRSALRDRTPNVVRAAFRRVENYGRRMNAWRQVLKDISGLDTSDKHIVTRAAALSPISSLANLHLIREPALLSDATVIRARSRHLQRQSKIRRPRPYPDITRPTILR